MAEPFQFDWTTAVPVDDEPQPSAPSTPTPPESIDAVMSATPFGAQNMPRPQQGPVDAYEEFDWKTAEPLDGGFDPSTAREATPAEDAEFYEQISNTAYLPTKDEWRWRENFRKQRDDKVSRFIEGGKAMAGGLVQAAAATAFAPFDFLRRGTAAYNEWVNSSAEGVRQTGIATAELWSWAGDVIADRGKEIERNAALDAKLRQQLASENRFTGNAETDGQVFLQAREAAMASGFYDKTPEELAEDEDTQYQRFIRDRSFQQQAENITETNIGTLPDGRAEMGIDESKLNPGLVTTTQLIADPLNIAAGGLGFLGKLRPLRRAAALAGKPLELGGKAAGAAAQKADELYAGIVEGIEGATGLNGAQQMSALQNPITWKAAAAMGTLKGAGGILRTGQTWLDTGSIFVREAGTGGVGVARVEAAGKLRTAPIPERYRRAYDGFFTSADSTLRRVSETPGLSPVARRSAATLDRIGATQAFRVADDAIGGALATAPIAVPLAAISPEERQPEMLGGLMTVGAVGGVAGGKVRRVAESDDALVAKMLADVEISGGDATSMANMLSHDKLLRMAQMQTVMSAKADFVPLRAKDYELNPTVNEHMGKNSRGFYVDATKGQRPRVFVNLDKLATGDVVGHEIGHAILKSDILGGQIKQGMRSVVDAQYGANGIAARGREYVKAQLTQEVNHRATGIEIEVLTPEESQRKAAGASMDELVADRWKNNPTWREQQINERVDLLNQEALGKGEMSFDWARDEIVAETFSGLGKGINVAGLRASGPIGRTLGAMQTAMETMGARFTGSGRLESPNRLFTENPLFDTSQMRKAVNNYVKLYDRYLVGLEKEGKVKQRGRPIAPTGRPEEAARSPHTRTYDNNGVLESELFIERPDGTRVPKSQQMIDTQEKARAATLKSINNRTRFVDENSSEWGARRLSNGRVEVGGPNLPPQFDYFVQVPQWLRDKAREFEAGRAEGRSYLYSNNAIGTRGSGRYKIKNLGNVEAKTGEMVPFGWAISTENHLLVKNIELNSFRAAAMRAIDKGQLGEFGNNLRTVEADLKQLMRNYEEGRPGETGLGVTKKNILNGLLGTGTPTNRASNPAWHTLNNQGSIRTFRLDRLNYADPYDTGYFPHYQKININALPDDAGRMSLDEYMRFDADRQAAWLNKRARERGYTNSTNWANSDEAGFAAASDEYRKLFPRPDNNNRMPSALPQAGMAMPEVAPSGRGQAMPDITITPEEARRRGLVGPVYHGSPDFKGRKFDPKYRARSSGLSRGGFSFSDNVASADGYASAPIDSAQAAVDSANDVMREAAGRMERGLKIKGFSAPDELPEFNVRYVDDIGELSSYFNELAKDMPKDLATRLRDAAKQVNEPANPVVVEAYLRNPKTMDIDGKKLWLVENSDDIFVSAARPPQGAATGRTRGQAMPDVAVERLVDSPTETPLQDTYRVRANKPLYRTVSLRDWERIAEQGFLDSDQRGAVSASEGANFATTPEVSKTYAPKDDYGVVLEIEPDAANWHGYNYDHYVRTWDKIPLNKIKVVERTPLPPETPQQTQGAYKTSDSSSQPLTTAQNIRSEQPAPMPDADEVLAANRTARAAGAVGARAITPRYVAATVRKGETVLNFGAGKPDPTTGKYGHSESVRAAGGVVDEFDFGANAVGALGKQYDTVMASNVLNVQSGRDMLRSTLSDIAASSKARAVMNYPESPRYLDLSADEVAAEIRSVFGAEPKIVGGTKRAPLWEVTKQQDAARGQAMPDVGININDSTQPFTSQILSGEKTIETRDTDSLRPYVGKRIGLVKTGAGQAMLVGYADVGEPTIYTSSSQFRRDEALHRVAKGSKFDIKQGGKKFGYPLTNVQAIEPTPVTSSGIVARKIPKPK